MAYIYGALGAALSFVGVILLITISRVLGFQSHTFNRIVLLICPLAGMIGGWYLYNFIESKRIETELEQDRIKYEQERQK
jgi:hypothetical protein